MLGPAPGIGVTVREVAEAMLTALGRLNPGCFDTRSEAARGASVSPSTHRWIRALLGWGDRLPGSAMRSRQPPPGTAPWLKALTRAPSRSSRSNAICADRPSSRTKRCSARYNAGDGHGAPDLPLLPAPLTTVFVDLGMSPISNAFVRARSSRERPKNSTR